jgi:hypothetical protein
MYAIKLELKLNNTEFTLMAQHAGFSRFVYNYGVALYKQVRNIKGGVTKKISAIRKVLINFTQKKPEYAWMNQPPDMSGESISFMEQNRHRINCFAESIGVLIDGVIMAISLHGLCTLPKNIS